MWVQKLWQFLKRVKELDGLFSQSSALGLHIRVTHIGHQVRCLSHSDAGADTGSSQSIRFPEEISKPLVKSGDEFTGHPLKLDVQVVLWCIHCVERDPPSDAVHLPRFGILDLLRVSFSYSLSDRIEKPA